MKVSEAWLIYIIAILVVYVILSVTGIGNTLQLPVKLLIALIVGAIIVLIIVPGITTFSADDRTWYSLLLVIAFVIPLLFAVWLIWKGQFNMIKLTGQQSCITEQNVTCEDDVCYLHSETKTCGDQKTITTYSGNGANVPTSKRTFKLSQQLNES
jgi:Na+(H+)/acetate symporter ActP